MWVESLTLLTCLKPFCLIIDIISSIKFSRKTFILKHEFFVNENVLIPRSETENIIDQIIIQGDKLFTHMKRCNFLDAGCGSGCVGITLAIERPNWNIFLSDISMNAINVAKKNSHLLNQQNIKFICEFTTNLDHLFDGITPHSTEVKEERSNKQKKEGKIIRRT